MPSSNSYTYMALIDRRISSNGWWTCKPTEMMIYNNKKAADDKCNSMKYGKPIVVSKEDAVKKITNWHTPNSSKNWLQRALESKLQEWHDDDWEES